MLTEVLSSLGFKSCAIDLDVQSNLTRQFIEIGVNQPVFSDVIDKKMTIEDIIINISPTLDLIPSSLKNGLIQKTLSIQTPKHYLTWFNVLCLNYLRSKYDVIIVDETKLVKCDSDKKTETSLSEAESLLPKKKKQKMEPSC